MSRKLIIAATVAGMLLADGLFFADTGSLRAEEAVTNTRPLAQIQAVVNDLIKVVAALPGEKNSIERRKKMREIITPHFDFREMAKRSLGDKWNKVTEAEQNEFTNLFSELLAKTYLNRLDHLGPDVVKFESERVGSSGALVHTTVKFKEDTFPLDYKLLLSAGHWRVYDVIIENIGLVQNYRNEFAGIIRKEGFPALIQRLKDKLKA